jgi:hypothetical protein
VIKKSFTILLFFLSIFTIRCKLPISTCIIMYVPAGIMDLVNPGYNVAELKCIAKI